MGQSPSKVICNPSIFVNTLIYERLASLASKFMSWLSPADVSTTENWRGYFGGGLSNRIDVTEESSLGLSAVYSSVRVLAEGLASLPFGVYEDINGKKSLSTSHPNHKKIHSTPNAYMTSFIFRETMMAHVLLWGNAYAEIVRGGNGRPMSFEIVEPWKVSITDYKGKLYYYINGKTPPVAAENMIHIPGLGFNGKMGKSPIRMQAESLGINLSAQRYGKGFFENGAHLSGVLKHPKTLSEAAQQRIKTSFKASYAGLSNVGEVAVLEEGLDYEKVGMPPEEAQFIQTRQFGKSDIAGFFKVPPHMIGDLTHATFSNIEHQDLSFVKHSLIPWLIRFEQEFDRKIFRSSEEGKYYTKHNANALMRGDSAARAKYYETMQKNGNLNSNEVRELEEMNPYVGGERYYVQANNMVPVDKIDEYLMSRAKTPAPIADSSSNGEEEDI